MRRPRRLSAVSWWLWPSLLMAPVGVGVALVLVALDADGAALVCLVVAFAVAAVSFTVVGRIVLRRSAALYASLDEPELTQRLDLEAVTAAARSGRRRAIPEAGRMVIREFPDLTPADAEAVVRRLLVHRDR